MAQYRKDILANNEIYHVFSRSIAGYKIFNSPSEFERMIDLIRLYRFNDFDYSYSKFSELNAINKKLIIDGLLRRNNISAEIIAYCLMPTHIHLILKQISDNGIAKYLAKALNSYSKYFNTKHSRSGPLWSGRFKNVLVKTDEQLLHLTRYIHLNPCSADLVKDPQDWSYSSYLEYITPDQKRTKICSYDNLFDFSQKEYKKFCLNRKSYQQELSKIKSLLIDDYTG